MTRVLVIDDDEGIREFLSEALARKQFDDYVKRVRVFVHPRLADEARGVRGLQDLIHEAIDRAG